MAILETPRLILRPHAISDYEEFHALWSDASVVEFLGAEPLARQATYARLLRNIGLWAAFGWGIWAVIDKVSGAYAGDVGFSHNRRPTSPSIDEMPEIAWALVPSMQGKGYATEAATEALKWADTHIASDRTCCLFDPENSRSIKVAENVGYRLWAVGDQGGPTPIYVRRRPV